MLWTLWYIPIFKINPSKFLPSQDWGFSYPRVVCSCKAVLWPSLDQSWLARRRGSLEVRTTPPTCHIALCVLTLQLEPVSFEALLALAQKPASNGLQPNWNIINWLWPSHGSWPPPSPQSTQKNTHSHHQRTAKCGEERWAVTYYCHSSATRSLVPHLYMGSRVIIPALLTLLGIHKRKWMWEIWESYNALWVIIISPQIFPASHPTCYPVAEKHRVGAGTLQRTGQI